MGSGNFSSGCFATGVVPGRAVRLFTDETKAVSKAAATLDRG